jgi:hypothetical protein
VAEILQEMGKSDKADALIARRLELTLRVTREDESRLKKLIRMRQLARLAKKRASSK